MLKTLCVALLLGFVTSAESSQTSIAYVKVVSGSTVAHTITVDLNNPNIKVSVALAKGGTGNSELFKSIVNRTHPAAAITGTFFDTKTLMPTGDIALFSTLVHSGCIGSALCIDARNRAAIVPLRKGRKNRWKGYETVMCAGPTLVSGGKVAIAVKHEGFRGSLYKSSRRTAVGITKAGKLLLAAFSRNTSLYDVAKLMVKLNVVDAVSLDGGSSAALYHYGRYFVMPGRRLTNCLVIYATTSDYQRARTALLPVELIAHGHTEQPALRPTVTASQPLLSVHVSEPTLSAHR